MIAHREPVTPIQEEFSTFDELACPVCRRNDRTDKVSSVVRRETGQAVALGAGGVFAFQTALSKALAVPEPPRAEPWTQLLRRTVRAWLFLAGVTAVVMLAPLPDLLGLPSSLMAAALIAAIGWFGFVSPVLSGRRLNLAKQAARRQLPLWAQARERWSRLYYCSRDDVVFVANEERCESPEQLLDLLYRREARPLS